MLCNDGDENERRRKASRSPHGVRSISSDGFDSFVLNVDHFVQRFDSIAFVVEFDVARHAGANGRAQNFTEAERRTKLGDRRAFDSLVKIDAERPRFRCRAVDRADLVRPENRIGLLKELFEGVQQQFRRVDEQILFAERVMQFHAEKSVEQGAAVREQDAFVDDPNEILQMLQTNDHREQVVRVFDPEEREKK